jgi:hypothetical protein
MAAAFEEVYALGRIRNGRLTIDHERAFKQQCSGLDPRWALEITVKRLRANRSNLQNRYYFGVVIATLSEFTGYTPDELHDFLKAKFIPKKLAICDGNGEVKGEVVVGGSTRKMTTQEFSEYCESIKRWAAEDLDVVIPDADQVAL